MQPRMASANALQIGRYLKFDFGCSRLNFFLKFFNEAFFPQQFCHDQKDPDGAQFEYIQALALG